MTDLEDLLTRELGAVADAETGPRVDLDGVRRVGRRERRRRGVVGIAAVVAAVAAVGGLGVLVPGGDDPVAPAAQAVEPLRLAWSEGDTVHLPSGRTIEVPDLTSVTARSGTTIVSTGGLLDPSWSLVVDTGGTPRTYALADSTFGSPVLSGGGQRVAWAEAEDERSYRLTSLDVATLASASTVLPVGTRGRTVLGVTGVDDRGRVVVERRMPSPLLWSGEQDAQPQPVADGQGLYLFPDGRAGIAGANLSYAVAEITDAGVLGPRVPVPGPVYAINGDATAYLLVPDGGPVSARLLDTTGSPGPGRTLRLPDGKTWLPLGWESPDQVVLGTPFPRGDQGLGGLERCSISTGDCEPVPSIGDGVVAGT